MSRTLHFESIGGASGDMILGALVSLGVSVDELNEELKSLKVDPFEIVVDEIVEQGMSGVRGEVVLHEHHHHHHDHDHDHHHGHDHDHHHGRHLSTIKKLIEASALPDPVKSQALDVFQKIGEAEAAIHGVDIEKIHFHEVGAMDSIVDIVGSCLALEKLGVDEVSIRNLPQGHGTIECAHGTYPNPAPATLRILEGFPVQDVDEPFELVTPTGAALMASWRTAEVPVIGSRAVKTAYSFGHRQLNGRPNLLRATLYESAEDQTADEVLVLECNLDDTTPELVGCLFNQLLEAGALDVFTAPVQMKKQRSGILLTVLCLPADRDRMLDLIFAESTTFGIRERLEKRTVLERSFQTLETPFGDVRVKIGKRGGKVITASPEIEDCRRLARENKVAVREVYDAAKKEI
ncbi:nickel pincer cofactor biosynthesis protein LarC [Pontiella agarivorans]|uniref:Putative nickel insertion protein n=1 Tax=Pontiella agarivorans TaxID=3038953 RepID=A0ABU5N1L7_9BACT|nr:nickel pincer cofactor biosynthesis protein LarC [Pontiella agarivorans]MDZ8120293.1 nickel pincer cofactor biosynthesis protein LarC [Pontiella agarivorans]